MWRNHHIHQESCPQGVSSVQTYILCKGPFQNTKSGEGRRWARRSRRGNLPLTGISSGTPPLPLVAGIGLALRRRGPRGIGSSKRQQSSVLLVQRLRMCSPWKSRKPWMSKSDVRQACSSHNWTWFVKWGTRINIAKGTTDPRVEFISHILIKFQYQKIN